MVHSRFTPRRWPATRRLLSLALLVVAPTLPTHAEPAVRANKPDPLDPKASVPTLNYESSFKQYRRLGDEKPLSWREANDTVTHIGGWRVYLREAQQPEPATAAMPPPPLPAASRPEPAKAMPVPLPLPPTVPQGHGGHKTP